MNTPLAPQTRILAARETVRGMFAAVGAEVVDPPTIQPAAPYLDVSGEDVRARLFFVDAPSGEQMVLRPDLTIPVCRLHLDRGGDPARPAAYWYEGKAFKFVPPGAGRAPEFVQVGLERFGDADPEAAEIETIGLALQAARAAGAHIGRFVLGDVGLFEAFVEGLGLGASAAGRLKRAFAARDGLKDALAAIVSPSPLAAALASLPAPLAAAALEEIYALADVEAVGGRTPAAIADRLLAQAADMRALRDTPQAAGLVERFAAIETAPRAALDEIATLAADAGCPLDGRLQSWARRLDRLEAIGAPLDRAVLSIGFARQFDYYDGLVFEARDPRLGAMQVLAAGGRYDRLVERLGAPAPVPAVGCMVRPGRLAASAEAGP